MGFLVDKYIPLLWGAVIKGGGGPGVYNNLASNKKYSSFLKNVSGSLDLLECTFWCLWPMLLMSYCSDVEDVLYQM